MHKLLTSSKLEKKTSLNQKTRGKSRPSRKSLYCIAEKNFVYIESKKNKKPPRKTRSCRGKRKVLK